MNQQAEIMLTPCSIKKNGYELKILSLEQRLAADVMIASFQSGNLKIMSTILRLWPTEIFHRQHLLWGKSWWKIEKSWKMKMKVHLRYNIYDDNCVVLSWFNPTKVRGGRGLRIVWTWIMDLLGHEHGPLTPEFQGRQSQGNQGK